MDVNGNVRANRFLGARKIEPGLIAGFRGGCPAGWAPVGGWDGRAIVGAGAFGATFDNPMDHVHTLNHIHNTDDPIPAVSTLNGAHGHTVSQGAHQHSYAGVSTGGASSFVNPGMDGGSEAPVRGDHGHDTPAGNTTPGGGGYWIGLNGDHPHAYDFPPSPYGNPTPLDIASSQFPAINLTFCSSP
jgi:hypothetical protein